MSDELHPGDVALAVEVLAFNQRIRIDAARDYMKHPASDNFEKMVNQTRAMKAEEDAAAIGRVIRHLSGAVPS